MPGILANGLQPAVLRDPWRLSAAPGPTIVGWPMRMHALLLGRIVLPPDDAARGGSLQRHPYSTVGWDSSSESRLRILSNSPCRALD